MSQSKILISLRDSDILDPRISPLFEPQPRDLKKVDFWKSMESGRQATEKTFFTDPALQFVERNYNNLRFNTSPQHSIPQYIHFIWLGSVLPEEFKAVVETWRNCHPNWEIFLWTEKEVANFTWSSGYIKWLYNNARSFGEKSDILRYDILFQMGGIYTDLDVICFKSWDSLIDTQYTFIAGQESNKLEPENEKGRCLCLSNALIAAAPQNPVIKYCLDHLISHEEGLDKSIMYRTGPLLLTRACQELLLHSEEREKMLILPCSYLYPLPFFHDISHKALTGEEIMTHFVKDESLTLHLWAATWYSA